MPFTFRPIDASSARTILCWRYEAPYDLYNHDAEQFAEGMNALLDPANSYYAVTEAEVLVAYCCFGPDGQVPGGDYQAEALDIGMGVRPDLTGRGRGLEFATAALEFARRSLAPDAVRVTVARFNKRAQRVWENAGFKPVQVFERVPDGLAFVVLTREG